MRIFMILPLTIKHEGGRICEDEMGGVYGTYGREKNYVKCFEEETCRKETTWKTKA
jgi:hypothetical protein